MIKEKSQEMTIESGGASNPLMQNLRGIFIIAKTDIISHLKSTRMVVLMIIFILTVLSGAYVFAGMAANYQEVEPPEFLVWTYIVNLDNDTSPNDALVVTTDTAGRPVGSVEITMFYPNETIIDVQLTDNQGKTIFYDFQSNLIEAKKDDYSVRYRPIVTSESQINQLLRDLKLYSNAQTIDLDEDNVKDDVAILVLDENQNPVSGAEIIFRNSGSGFRGSDDTTHYTNQNGFFQHRSLLKGEYIYEIRWNEEVSEEKIDIKSDDTDVENLVQLESPDDVLVQVASFFIAMIVPIIAIGIAFDSISREKLSKSVVFLLCRPIGKRSIAIGKFLGSITAVSIPLIIVSLISVGIIAGITNESPTGSFVAGFIVVTIVFMAIFVLLQQNFSTIARSTGNSIMSGIFIWLFFYIFWSLIVLGINVALGNQIFSSDYFDAANKMNLISPVGIYSFIIVLISPTSGTLPSNIPTWAPYLSYFVWFTALFILAMELFRKKPYL